MRFEALSDDGDTNEKAIGAAVARRLEVATELTARRTALAFWLLGACNNTTWVLMNAGAGSIAPGQ
jgi:hypothetical protein